MRIGEEYELTPTDFDRLPRMGHLGQAPQDGIGIGAVLFLAGAFLAGYLLGIRAKRR